MIKTPFSCDIKSLQTNWGGKFRNVSICLKNNGIQHCVPYPYTQEQNDAVECRNCIIDEKFLTLLSQSSLPQLFWEHAFKTATYLHKVTITPTLNYASPYQKLYHKTPYYDFLKTFGYPFLFPYNKHKIDFRSLPCIFIGYNASHKGYICFHQSTSRIYISRHVVFNEDIFPYTSTTIMKTTQSSPPNHTTFTLLQHADNI